MQFHPNKAQTLMKTKDVIREAAPKSMKKISYAMPTFFLNDNLLHFAAHKNHIGFTPNRARLRNSRMN